MDLKRHLQQKEDCANSTESREIDGPDDKENRILNESLIKRMVLEGKTMVIANREQLTHVHIDSTMD
jgi:hypothetical protein